MVLRFLIYLTILCIEINGEPLYPSDFEDRLNALEYELIQTKDDLRETKDRLTIAELQNQEQHRRNKELELKLANNILKTDSNYLDLKERLGLTETELILTKDKLKATDKEMSVTKAKLKATDKKLMNTITKPKTTIPKESFSNTKPNAIDAKPNAVSTYDREYHTKPYFVISDSNNTMAKINTTNMFDRKPELNSGKRENKTANSNKVKRVDELPLGSMIAFHAELGPTESNLTPGQTITFETVKQNFGNGYDPQVGVFTSPKYGLYFFTFAMLSNPTKRVDTQLVVNGSPIAYSLSAGNNYNLGSQSVIVPLHLGDRVWLEFSGSDNTIHGGYWSTFTGFIISAT